MVDEAVPGNIRKAEHFIAFLKRFIEYLKVSFVPLGLSQVELTISADSDACLACRRRDSAVLLGSFEGDYLHRAPAPQVSCMALAQGQLMPFTDLPRND